MDNEENKQDVIHEKPKKKRKGLKRLVIFLVVVGIIAISLGCIFPGLLWTRSLGVSYDKADYNSIMSKLEYVKDAVPDGSSADQYTYNYGEVKSVDVEFTSEEITAFFNENRPSYYAVKNVQVKVNNDGTIEAVGSANVDYFLNDVLTGKYSKEQIQNQLPILGILPSNVNLYLKFSGSVVNNKSNVNIESVSVQGITIPNSMVDTNEAVTTVTDGLNNMMAKYNTKTGSNFNNISVENGKIKFQGNVPSSLERIKQ